MANNNKKQEITKEKECCKWLNLFKLFIQTAILLCRFNNNSYTFVHVSWDKDSPVKQTVHVNVMSEKT